MRMCAPPAIVPIGPCVYIAIFDLGHALVLFGAPVQKKVRSEMLFVMPEPRSIRLISEAQDPEICRTLIELSASLQAKLLKYQEKRLALIHSIHMTDKPIYMNIHTMPINH
jgi:hypothetical protein